MLDDIVIKAARPEYLSQLESWNTRNNAVKILLKSPQNPAAGNPETERWVALLGEEVVAVVTLEFNKEHVGYIQCVVKAGHQRQGIGTRIMEYVLSLPSVKSLTHLHAAIDQTNIPAQKVLDSHGFSRVGYHADGRMEYARHLQKASGN